MSKQNKGNEKLANGCLIANFVFVGLLILVPLLVFLLLYFSWHKIGG